MKPFGAFKGAGVFCAELFLFGFLSVNGSPTGHDNASKTSPITGKYFNQVVIHDFYTGGEFDSVFKHLAPFYSQHFTDSNPGLGSVKTTFNRLDSLFAAKHLGVIYAANPNTLEKGKYYLNLLIELAPESELADMEPSGAIYIEFERLKKEYAARQHNRSRTNQNVYARNDSIPTRRDSVIVVKPASTPQPKSKISPWVWLAGVGGLAAAISAAYVLSDVGEKSPTKAATDWDVKVKVSEE